VRTYAAIFFLFFLSCQNEEQVDPIVRTGEVQNIGQNNATLVGKLEDPGATQSWVYGFVWSELPGPNMVTGNLIVLGERTNAGEFSANQENLIPNTVYYVKAYVSDKSFSSIFYAAETDFRTLP